MKKLFLLLLLSLSLISFSSWGADFQKGLDAYGSGDYATALREWRLLAEQGHAIAQFNLGVMYDKGEGVLQDNKTAVKWYTLAAEQGHANAQFSLGRMYAKGQGVTQDYKTAVKWFTLAAEQGHAAAQTGLGLMYAIGDSVPQDYIYAHMWANLGASNGDERGAKFRDDYVVKHMTPSQIEKAQELARECVRKKYKGC
tara:strand:- start:307 stop:900 length:594 start_codon:yes stop_codon:yes gene_type:complete